MISFSNLTRLTTPLYVAIVLLYSCALFAADDANDNSMKHGEMKHGEMKHDDHHAHSHGLLDVSDWANQPHVSMKVVKDAMSGWNIRLDVENFTFSPENVNGENREGEGHAHLYVNEEKEARLYGAWYHLPALPAGRHSIKVQLNANDHATLAVGQNPIEIITIVTEE